MPLLALRPSSALRSLVFGGLVASLGLASGCASADDASASADAPGDTVEPDPGETADEIVHAPTPARIGLDGLDYASVDPTGVDPALFGRFELLTDGASDPALREKLAYHEAASKLGVTATRRIIKVADPDAPNLDWIAHAKAAGVTDFWVSIEVSSEWAMAHSVQEYGQMFRAHVRALKGSVRWWSATNEPELTMKSAHHKMELAADYHAIADRVLKQECSGCRMVAGEFAGSRAAYFHRGADLARYMDRLAEHLRRREARRPLFWSVHPYGDIDDPNNAHEANIAGMVQALGAKWGFPELWLGESGTRLQYRLVSGNRALQAEGARRFLTIARADSHRRSYDPRNQVQRLYWWDFQDSGWIYGTNPDGSPHRNSHPGPWDSGLLEPKAFGGLPRPAFCVLVGQAPEKCAGDTEYHCPIPDPPGTTTPSAPPPPTSCMKEFHLKIQQ